MEKETVIVELIKPSATRSVIGKYDITRENPETKKKETITCYVDEHGQYNEMPTSEYHKIALGKEKGGKSQDIMGLMHFNFSTTLNNLVKGMDDEEKLKWTAQGLKFELNGDKSKAGFVTWFDNHPASVVNEVRKTNGIDPIFRVIHQTKGKKKQSLAIEAKTEIINYILGLRSQPQAKQEFSNYIIWFGGNPLAMDIDEMVVCLIEDETVRDEFGHNTEHKALLFEGNNATIFRNTFMNDENPNKTMVLTIAKAKIHGKFQTLTKEGVTGYYWKTNFIGTTDQDLFKYLNNHEDVYNIIKQEIEAVEGINNLKEENLIPEAAKVKDISGRTELARKLSVLVKAGKVKLPEGKVIATMSEETMETLIAIADNVTEYPVEEKVNSEEQVVIDNTAVFTKQQEGEIAQAYRGRLLKQAKKLNLEIKGQSVKELEKVIKGYFKTLKDSSTSPKE